MPIQIYRRKKENQKTEKFQRERKEKGEEMEYPHQPVLLQRCLDLFAPALELPGAICVDITLGMGGHSEALLTRFPELTLIGIDRDPAALKIAGERLAKFSDRTHLVSATYDQLSEVLHELNIEKVQGVLGDLGVSSLQLDEVSRGFAYSRESGLDMRMNPLEDLTAEVIVNEYSAPEIIRILREYGEERFAPRIASAILRERAIGRLTSSSQLVDIVRDAIPAATRRTGGNPAKRTFQALRIAVNDELGILERAVPQSLRVLEVGGRVVMMAYHSLEDRIVKRYFMAAVASDTPLDLPVDMPSLAAKFRLISKGESPSDDEILENPRAASARLRAVERVAA